MSKKGLINLGLLLASATLSLAIGEIVLRTIGFKYDYAIKLIHVGEEWRDYHMYEDQMFEPDPFLLWKPRPSSHYYVPFNSKGYRGKEFTDDKDGGEIRILAIGDSNTLGDAERSWPGFLQELLDRRCLGKRWTVINAGVYGYTSFQGVIRLREALRYRPDVVLVSFGWNDAVETTNEPDRSYGEASTRFMGAKRFLSTHLRLYHLVRAAGSALSTRRAGDPKAVRARVPLDDYEANLETIVSIARQHGIGPVLLTRPNHVGDVSQAVALQRWRNHLGSYNEIVQRLGARDHVPVVDAYGMFQGKADAFTDDSHLNTAGLRALAEKLTDLIQEQYRPPCAASG